ncbi:MAG: hypothetical protein AAB570_03460 [Patescibacteria group bacterium]
MSQTHKLLEAMGVPLRTVDKSTRHEGGMLAQPCTVIAHGRTAKPKRLRRLLMGESKLQQLPDASAPVLKYCLCLG